MGIHSKFLVHWTGKEKDIEINLKVSDRNYILKD